MNSQEQRLSFGWFSNYHARFDMFNDIMETYQRYNLSGGSLHIYLEDGNKKISDIKFCRNYAKEKGDNIGVYLCEELLYYGEDFIIDYIDSDPHLAFAVWYANNKDKSNA